jgi:hypothetical protein
MGTSETGAVYYRGTCGHVWRVDRDQRPIGETRCPFCRAVAYAADTDGYPEHNPVVAERTALRAALSAAESARATAEARLAEVEAERDVLREAHQQACAGALAARAELARLQARIAAWERSGMVRGVDCAPAPAQGDQ